MYDYRTQNCSRRFPLLISAACVLPLLGGARALAEPAPLPARMVPMQVDSGRLENLRAEPVVVFSQTLDLGPDVPWARLFFDEAGTVLPPGSYIRVTSLLDGETQILDAEELENWGDGTAFFNGSQIEVELIAGGNTVANKLLIRDVFTGEPAPQIAVVAAAPGDDPDPILTICGGTDDRVPIGHAAVGRLLSGGIQIQRGTDRVCNGGVNQGGQCTGNVDCPGDAAAVPPIPPGTCVTPGQCRGGLNPGMACLEPCADGICARLCSGGVNNGLLCVNDADCPGVGAFCSPGVCFGANPAVACVAPCPGSFCTPLAHPSLCTAFIIEDPNNPGMDKAHLTAGHCFLDRAGRVDQNLAKDSVLQFNVPSSNANCTINHPPVARQFPVKRGMVIAGLLDRICNAASTNAGAKCVADAECLGADPNRRCVVNGFCNAASANPGAACDPNRDAGNPHADCLGADPNRRCIVNAFCNAASTNANAPCNKDADCLGANPNRRCDGSTIGNDWAVFKCGKNNEGKTTYEKQGTAMPLAPAVPVVGTTLYVTGYGVDGTDADNAGGGTPASCTCNPGRNTGTRNAVLQTHSGPLLLGGPKADRLNHQVDTCGGNSGSPINNPGASFTPVIGIHTNAGCGADGGGGVVGANAGTAITNPDLVAAMEKLGRKKLPPVCGNNLREGTEACDGTDAACCLLGPCQPDCTCPSASPVNYGCACADNTDFSGSAVDCNLALDGPGGCVSLCATHGGIRKPEPPDGPPDQSPELHGFACPQSCVPGDHWIDCCTAGIDKLESNALVGIDTNMDCMLDPDPAVEPRLFFSGPVTILRSRPTDVSMNDFPPTPPKTPPFDDMLDGHFDVMDTEIIHMRMTGGSGDCLVRLTAGAEKGQRFPLNPSLGAIVERPAAVPWTCAFPLTRCADSFFEVFFEIELGDGTFLYNQDPLLVHAEIDQVPPDLGTKYVHGLVGDVCIPLYTSPTGGVRVANFIQGDHLIVKPPATGCCLVDCSCTNIDPAMCTQAGGVPANNNRKCSGGDRDGQRCDDLNPCPRGTCVPGSGSCRGDDGKDCVDDACLVACCDHLKGTCTDVQMSKCDCEQCTFTCGTTCAALVAAGGCPAEIWACCDHDTFGICTNTTHNACNCAKCEWTKGKLCDEVECTHKTIPTVSEWGLVVMTLLLLTGAKIYFGRRPLETRD